MGLVSSPEHCKSLVHLMMSSFYAWRNQLSVQFREIFAEYPTRDAFEHNFSVQLSYTGSTSSRALRPGEVRLVRIAVTEGNGSEETIRCITQVVPLSNSFDYEAVSYAWGCPIANDRRYRIELDGRAVLLPKNIWRFLRQYRDLRRNGWLWIDALSIDQDNLWERSHQVQRMAEIFGRAEQVVVWLGTAYAGSERAMEMLLSGKSWYGFREEFYHLCERPYWRRLWVCQELMSARQIVLMCGNSFLPWDTFRSAQKVAPADDTLAKMMVDLTGGWSHKAGRVSLGYLMRKSRHLCCADQRDRVYALANCAGGIRVDYKLGTTELAKSVLQNACGDLIQMPTLGMILTQCQELISIFGLEPTSVLEITEGALSDSPFCAYPEYRRAMLTSLPKADNEWPKSFPRFDVLSEWAHSHDKRTVYKSLLQHMGMTWVPLWHKNLDFPIWKDINDTGHTPPTIPARMSPRSFSYDRRTQDSDLSDCADNVQKRVDDWIQIPSATPRPRPYHWLSSLLRCLWTCLPSARPDPLFKRRKGVERYAEHNARRKP